MVNCSLENFGKWGYYKAVAAKSGYSRQHIAKGFNNLTSFSTAALDAISLACGVSPSELIEFIYAHKADGH